MIHCMLLMLPVWACADAPVPVASASAQTNLVWIMTDDQGVWTVGCYGNREARTPNLDRMAGEGVRFAKAFATIPVCSPSRATFFTGRIASQHGIHDWIKHENMGPRARYCLEGEVQLSEVLASHGYVCGLSGKWHLGDSLHPRAGYTYWFAMPQGGSQYNDADMVRDGQVVPTTGYLTDRITDAAVAFIDQYKDRPFFINVEYNAPHSPYVGHPQEMVDLYRDCPFASIPKLPAHPWSVGNYKLLEDGKSLVQYLAACSGVDRAVGRILAHLDKLGLSENTLVIYTSDQGFNFGHHGLIGKGNASNPRNMYDTSLQIPLIFRHRGRVPTGRVVDLPVSAYDLVPTVLAYLGLPPSPGRNLPGHSFAESLRGEPQPDWPDAIFAEYSHARTIRTARYKYVHRANGGPFELYDLQNDPDETTNLIDRPELKTVRIELRKRMMDWFDRYAEAGADPIGNEYLRPD